jgi:hypothetical protein
VVDIYTYRDGRWRIFSDAWGLPHPPSTLALKGNDLWVGGEGYIAVVDLDKLEVRKLCYVPTPTVNHLQLGGGYIWAQFAHHLYRVALRDMH